jgi:F0F1-type ATP synthase assembly protein I
MSLSGRHPRSGAGGYPLASRPIRNVLRWQGIAALVGAGISAVLGGTAAAWSAAAGGAIPLVSTVVYALVLGLGNRTNAGSSVVTMLRAEGAKIATIIGGLWMVLRWYPDVVASALFITFVVSVLLFRVAFLSREAGGVPPN